MKSLLIVVLAVIIFLYACNKTNLQAPDNDGAAPQSSEHALATAVLSKSDLLTAHSWMYKAYYLHYQDQTHKGDAQYVRGSNNNIINLRSTRFSFNKDGTFLESEQGYRYPGTWQFTNSAHTLLVMTFSWGTEKNIIISLDNSHLNYKRAIGSYSHGNFSYTELITVK